MGQNFFPPFQMSKVIFTLFAVLALASAGYRDRRYYDQHEYEDSWGDDWEYNPDEDYEQGDYEQQFGRGDWQDESSVWNARKTATQVQPTDAGNRFGAFPTAAVPVTAVVCPACITQCEIDQDGRYVYGFFTCQDCLYVKCLSTSSAPRFQNVLLGSSAQFGAGLAGAQPTFPGPVVAKCPLCTAECQVYQNGLYVDEWGSCRPCVDTNCPELFTPVMGVQSTPQRFQNIVVGSSAGVNNPIMLTLNGKTAPFYSTSTTSALVVPSEAIIQKLTSGGNSYYDRTTQTSWYEDSYGDIFGAPGNVAAATFVNDLKNPPSARRIVSFGWCDAKCAAECAAAALAYLPCNCKC